MAIVPGNGLLIKAIFADGSECSNARTFLVIEISGTLVRALNVSSIRGKEHKLAFPSNKRITQNFPPFNQPSFLKLDALYEFELFQQIELSVLCRGRCLDSGELSTLSSHYSLYKSDNPVQAIQISRADLIARNPHLLRGIQSNP